MTYAIDIQNAHDYHINEDQLRCAADAILDMHETPHDTALSIVITDNAAVQALNQQYRNVDAPTDVLSFPAEMPDMAEMQEDSVYLGDLIIAYPYAAIQAEHIDHPLAENLVLLVIHGTLHLLGYDHDTSANQAEMWAVQAQALASMNISDAIVPALAAKDTAHDE